MEFRGVSWAPRTASAHASPARRALSRKARPRSGWRRRVLSSMERVLGAGSPAGCEPLPGSDTGNKVSKPSMRQVCPRQREKARLLQLPPLFPTPWLLGWTPHLAIPRKKRSPRSIGESEGLLGELRSNSATMMRRSQCEDAAYREQEKRRISSLVPALLPD